jgi:hypothetical protein
MSVDIGGRTSFGVPALDGFGRCFLGWASAWRLVLISPVDLCRQDSVDQQRVDLHGNLTHFTP